MSSFYTDVIQKDSRYHSTAVCNDVNLLEPGTRAAVARLLTLAHAAGHELKIIETYRSPARQKMLFDTHKTQIKDLGCHSFGVAADLALFVNGKYDPTGEHYAFLKNICSKVGLIPGETWGTPKLAHSFKDWDHVQRAPVFRQPAMFAGSWYPPIVYDPYADQLANHVKGI